MFSKPSTLQQSYENKTPTMADVQRVDAELLIPGKGQPIERATIVWRGNKIEYAGPQNKLPAEYRNVSSQKHSVIMPGMSKHWP